MRRQIVTLKFTGEEQKLNEDNNISNQNQIRNKQLSNQKDRQMTA